MIIILNNVSGEIEKELSSKTELIKYIINDLKELLVWDKLEDKKDIEKTYQEIKDVRIIED